MRKRRFRCPVCGVETKSFSTCRNHYVLKHDEKPSIAAKAVLAENQDITDQKVQNIQEFTADSYTGREAVDIEAATDSSGQPGQEAGNTGGINEILDRILARTRKPLAESENRAPDDKARITELEAEVVRLSDHDHEIDLVSAWARDLSREDYLELGVKLGYVEEIPVEDSADSH